MSEKVKICGLKRMEDVDFVNREGADYAGFVFHPDSHRNVSFSQAKALMACLSDQIKSVAVCVSPSDETYREICKLQPDIIQIHGQIPQIALDFGGIPLWQAVNLKKAENFCGLFLHHPKIIGYVIDGAGYGGGKTFGWERDEKKAKQLYEQLQKERQCAQLILAGGLTEENAGAGIRLFHPDILDVSSSVETDGRKDEEKIKRFIRKVKER